MHKVKQEPEVILDRCLWCNQHFSPGDETILVDENLAELVADIFSIHCPMDVNNAVCNSCRRCLLEARQFKDLVTDSLVHLNIISPIRPEAKPEYLPSSGEFGAICKSEPPHVAHIQYLTCKNEDSDPDNDPVTIKTKSFDRDTTLICRTVRVNLVKLDHFNLTAREELTYNVTQESVSSLRSKEIDCLKRASDAQTVSSRVGEISSPDDDRKHKCHPSAGHGDSKTFTCGLCDKVFKQKCCVKRHVRRHNDKQSFDCDVCFKTFTTSYNLRSHMVYHSDERSFMCGICYKTFKLFRYLKTHTTLAHPDVASLGRELKLNCTVCSREFKHRMALRAHMMQHSDVKEFECDVCWKNFKSKQYLRRHIIIHGDRQDFKCDVCFRIFKNKTTLRHHMVSHDDKIVIKCTVCSKEFKHHSSLRSHMMIHSDVKKFKCDVCSTSFKTKEYLKRHMRSHSDKRNFVCGLCPDAFKTRRDLGAHAVYSHSERRNFKCAVCPKGFLHAYDLKKHMISHSDQRKFKCAHCFKAFKWKIALKNHTTAAHRGGFSFKCTVCSKGFKYRSSQNRHMAGHCHAGRFERDVCSKPFQSREDLEAHVKCHGDERDIKFVID